MLPQRSVTMLQLLGAALGIPAAAAGCYSAYQTYFSTEAVCQRLRTAIVITMERKLASDAKKALLRRDVAEFDKTCGDSDPDARTVFQAALREHPASSRVPDARVQIAAADAQLSTATPSLYVRPVPVFSAAGSGERHGWIALSRRQAGAWISNFDGYAISETSLLPLGTVLIAQRQLPVDGATTRGLERPDQIAKHAAGTRLRARSGNAAGRWPIVGASGAGFMQWLGCAGSAGSGRLGRQFPRLCNL